MKSLNNHSQVIRVGVVDDHKAVARGLTALLNTMPPIRAVLEVYSGPQLLDLLVTMKELPDILLMDVDMKGMNGIEATKWVTELYPSIKTVAFSAKDDDLFILQMIGVGACAYLSKNVSPERLEQAIHEVHNKGKYQADLYQSNSGSLRKLSKDIANLSISDKERCYLQLLCKGYAYTQIATEMGLTVKSVNYYRKCLCEKLGATNLAKLAYEGLRLGIISLHDITANIQYRRHE
jgi:DNA-binding NarL/FixJ family response regulator